MMMITVQNRLKQDRVSLRGSATAPASNGGLYE